MISADRVLSEAQLNKFLKTLRLEKEKSIQAIQGSKKRNPKEVRTVIDYFLFSLIANTGLRVSEALNLKKEDVHEDFIIAKFHPGGATRFHGGGATQFHDRGAT